MIPYGLIRRMKRGTQLSIFLTCRCNLCCDYCCNLTFLRDRSKRPVCDELRPSEWIYRIEHFPIRLNEIFLTGGEPLLYKNIEVLMMWIVKNTNVMLTIFSNLMIVEPLLFVNSRRLRIVTSIHDKTDQGLFQKNIERLLSWGYKVVVEKFDPECQIQGRTKKKESFEDIAGCSCWHKKRFFYTPDGMLWINALEAMKYVGDL